MQPQIEQAVKLLQEQRPQSIERALELLQGTVLSFGMKVCGHREDAEDTAQEVLLKAIPYLPRFTSPQALGVWLYKVAKNQCLMGRRRSKFAPERELSLDELMPGREDLQRLVSSLENSPEDSVQRAEEMERLQDAVLRLQPDYRLILVLHDMEELSTAEVSKITGLQEGTVRVRLHRARLFLRKELNTRALRTETTSLHRPERAFHERDLTKGRCKKLFAELSDYLDNELDDSLCEELERHLSGCAPCGAFLSSLEQTIRQCRQYRPPCQHSKKATKLRRELIAQYRRAMTMAKSRQPVQTGS